MRSHPDGVEEELILGSKTVTTFCLDLLVCAKGNVPAGTKGGESFAFMKLKLCYCVLVDNMVVKTHLAI